MLKVGLIGAGRVAELHARALSHAGEVEVVAVADPRNDATRRFTQAFGGRAYRDYRDVLALPEVEAVDVMVPHSLHAEIAVNAVRAGKHVFMDKPLATTVEAGRTVAEAISATDRVVMICHNLLFHPAVVRASEVIARGLLGELRLAHAWSTGWIDLSPWDFRRDKVATGGGAWIDNGPHLIYVLERLVGRMTSLTAALGQGPSRLGGEDSCGALCQFDNGVVGTMNISYSVRNNNLDQGWPGGWHEGVRVEGTTGTVEVRVLPKAHVMWSGEQGRGEWTADDVTFGDSFAGALREWLSAINEGRTPRVDVADALHCLELTMGALGSGHPSVVTLP